MFPEYFLCCCVYVFLIPNKYSMNKRQPFTRTTLWRGTNDLPRRGTIYSNATPYQTSHRKTSCPKAIARRVWIDANKAVGSRGLPGAVIGMTARRLLSSKRPYRRDRNYERRAAGECITKPAGILLRPLVDEYPRCGRTGLEGGHTLCPAYYAELSAKKRKGLAGHEGYINTVISIDR